TCALPIYPRSGGLQHGESRGGGCLCREAIWNQGQDFSADELQSREARTHFDVGSVHCGERRKRPGVCVHAGGGVCRKAGGVLSAYRSEEHTSELQSRFDLVCRLLLE